MNNAHLKPRIEPISELLLLVKPAASSCPPLDHEFPFVGSRVSTLGSTFTVEGFPTCQKCQKVCYVILCYVMLCRFFGQNTARRECLLRTGISSINHHFLKNVSTQGVGFLPRQSENERMERELVVNIAMDSIVLPRRSREACNIAYARRKNHVLRASNG